MPEREARRVRRGAEDEVVTPSKGNVFADLGFTDAEELRPEKLEVMDGKLLWDDDERLALLGLLLENVGADRAVRLGDPAVWRAAVEGLSRSGAGAEGSQ